MRVPSLALALALALAGVGLAPRQSPPVLDHRRPMETLASLLGGVWTGSGTLDLGPGRRFDVAINLTVGVKADGNLLVLDAAYTLTPRSDPRTPASHDEVALLFFDDATRQIQSEIFYADGHREAGTATLDGAVLSILNPLPAGGFRRLTIDLRTPGECRETGERSPDGAAWQAYFHDLLRRAER